jgi:hypothetical protein
VSARCVAHESYCSLYPVLLAARVAARRARRALAPLAWLTSGPRPLARSLASLTRAAKESLFQRLLVLWGSAQPRVIVDLGSHPAFGDIQQFNDATIFAEYFHAPGGRVLAVDAMPEFAEDVRRRMVDEPPLAGYAGMTYHSLAAWVGNYDAYDPPAALPRGPNITFRVARQLGYCLAGHSFDHTVNYCALERAGRALHMCRVVRERLGVLCPPGSVGPQPALSAPPPKRATVPFRSIDSLWKRELGGAHIDVLKVDIEASWPLHYGAGAAALVAARAVSVLIVEIDQQWRERADGSAVTIGGAVAEFVAQMEAAGYATYLKVPCSAGMLRRCAPRFAASGGCVLDSVRNRTIGYERYLKLSHEARAVRLPRTLRLQQDLLLIDAAQPELLRLVDSFPPPCPADGSPPDIDPRLRRSGGASAALTVP